MLSLATRVRALLVPALSATVLLAGCGAVTGDSAGEGREVVASFYPLAWVTEQVAGDSWTVSNLTSPGGEPHDLELSIDSTAALTEAELVVYLEDFQPAVDDAVATNVSGATFEASEFIDMEPITEHSEEGVHVEGDVDPHFWLDPARMAELATAVSEELAVLDEAGAESYRANAEELVGELEALDADYDEGLASCERDTVVVSHDAFGYLEKYGLRFEPIAGLSPGAEPTPAALAELTDLIREEGITTVFSERLASPAMAESLASDLDVTTGVLDPLEGLTDDTAEEDYVSLMRNNLAALQEANGC